MTTKNTRTRSPPNEHQGFWRSVLTHRRAVKLKKIEMKTAVNWNTWLLGILALVGIMIIVVGIVLASILNTVIVAVKGGGDSMFSVINQHPAMGVMGLAALKGVDLPKDAWYVALATELNANARVQGSFSGHFETKRESYLEKADLTCVDQYSYGAITRSSNDHIEELERLNDTGCVTYRTEAAFTNGTANGYTINYYKCPLHNCAMMQKYKNVTGQFLPDKLDIRDVQAATSGVR